MNDFIKQQICALIQADEVMIKVNVMHVQLQIQWIVEYLPWHF